MKKEKEKRRDHISMKGIKNLFKPDSEIVAKETNIAKETKSTFTWDRKWTQTGFKSQTALKCRSIYMTIYIEIWLRQLSKQ